MEPTFYAERCRMRQCERTLRKRDEAGGGRFKTCIFDLGFQEVNVEGTKLRMRHVRLSNLTRKHNTHKYGWFQLACLLATLLELLLSPERLGCCRVSPDGLSVYQPFSCQSRSIAVFECLLSSSSTHLSFNALTRFLFSSTG